MFEASYGDVSDESLLFFYKNNRLSWGDVRNRSLSISKALTTSGAVKNDVVAIMLEHCPGQALSFLGVSHFGGIFTLVANGLREGQIKNQLSDAGAKFVIVNESLYDSYKVYFSDTGIIPILLNELGEFVDSNFTIEDFSNSSREWCSRIPADVACYVYTSGSTGRAKGVVVPHRTLLDGARIVSGYLKIGPMDRLIQMLPLSFDYGMNQFLTTIYKKAQLYFYNYVLPGDLLRFIEENEITAFATVPSVWPNLFNPKYVKRDEFGKFEKLRYITTAGGFHSLGLLKKIKENFPTTDVFVMYGLTESFRSSFLPPEYVLEKPGSIGKAVPEVELRVVNSEGLDCAPGEKGELIHRGAFVNYGYLNNPDLTAEKYIRLPTGGRGCVDEVAVRSGDLCSKDEQGFIYFHGRIDSQIKVKGFRVSPGEIEEYVLSFADVKSAACFALYPYDSDKEQQIGLAITSYSDEPIDEKELKLYLRKFLPNYAVPSIVKHFDNLPLNSNGKVSVGKLKEIMLGEHAN